MSAGDRAQFTAQIRQRRGPRRRVAERVHTSVKLPQPIFDALCQRALREGVSLHALMNRELASAASRTELR